MSGLFIPGWGAPASLYRAVLPHGWETLEPPSFRSTKGSIAAYRSWLRDELARRPGPLTLGGHSFGAALAVLATSDGHANVQRLILVDPAGLPLSKPYRLSARDFAWQIATGLYPLVEAARAVGKAVVAPGAALRLARAVRALDLGAELASLRSDGLPCTVVSSHSDTLTTPDHCREIARLSGGEYRELRVGGGHMWFLGAASLHRQQLA